MRILALDADIHGPGIDEAAFRSAKSMFEYDVVVWDPASFVGTYARDPWNATYQGYPCISTDDSARLIADVARRRKEIISFLEMGRVFVVLSAPPSHVYYATGETKTSGTGRNATKINTVASLDAVGSCLPVEIESTEGVGDGIEPKDEGFRAVWRASRDAWFYRAIFTKFPGTPLATVSGTDKVIASILRTKGEGIFLLLPALYPILEDDREDAEDDVPKSLFSWISQLKGGKENQLPEWAERYKFPEDLQRSARIAELEETLASVLDEIEIRKAEKAAADQWKLLFTSSGSALEEQAKRAFEEIGFTVQDGPPGRTDLRLEWEGRQAVAEVKGVGKSATEGNAAQLEKWISEERIAGVQDPKGLLVVNAWRKEALEDRRDTFPHQMLKFCKQREHCLVTGFQLLAMARACREDPGRKAEVARSLMETVGVMPGWSEVSSVFVAQATEVVEGSTDPKTAEVQGENVVEA
ncbi:hypothetical protein [Streptomyces rubrogriseus]|uniref:Uncharacterized protein n=1 Tax=Streptomyces rubrogriseus TaxID=194673 RepID=A0A6G3T956_9ACTN|nr:hypothetical protein [Streptomyces rubrogriseus]NEC33247.1 hypothetical protein [Streptomyces rubrogriseus]